MFAIDFRDFLSFFMHHALAWRLPGSDWISLFVLVQHVTSSGFVVVGSNYVPNIHHAGDQWDWISFGREICLVNILIFNYLKDERREFGVEFE